MLWSLSNARPIRYIMKIAPPTADEAARLKALYDYEVLDTEAEKFVMPP